ncbi:hypothetical protein JKF63_06109 [Porcisia hertigi]|uniref:Uncharacterized protein n=1 Tax=Porcisia hertigi TaxID=2761500 RepID=A0A836INZ3_9TRYP|nr:hypothetical protein JKF63_06109 [Porcisia hertigi]
MAANSPSTTPFSGGVSSTLTTRQAARPLSLLDLDESVFNYVCAFVPLNDLLRNLAAASHAMWRRVSVSNSLWQQLWMRYLLHFCNSLIPQATTETLEAAEAVAAAPCMPYTDAHVTTAPRLRRNSSSAWYLYHFHHSAETKPRVVRLEELCLVHKDIVDPRAATPPTPHLRLNEPKTAELHLQLLRFAQRYATQTVARNVTHTTVPYSPLFASLPLSDQQEGAVQGGTLAQSKQQHRQAHRLQRVLHFLLSESGRRPQLYDRLWGATNEAKMEFIRRTCTAGPTPTATHDRNATPSTAAKPAKQQNSATPFSSHGMIAPPTPPVRLRPMSWLDDEETSVKVLLFSEDMRSVGDAAAVHEERSKLLASIAANWRIAYASNFYPCETDGNDPVIPLQLPASSLSPASATVAAAAGRGAASRVLGAERGSHQPQPTLHRGQSSWEQVYRRFRDDRSAVNRPIARPQQHAATQREDLTSDDDAVVPSSSNPLFDLHILGYEKRKQLYSALLASTVEVPDGMGMFFATCVSESFLRWLCWRNRRHTEAKEFSVGTPNDADGGDRGGPPMRHHIALPPFTAGRNAMSPPGSLWVVQVAAGDPRDYVEKSEKRKHSVTYSSSYSDVTTTMTDTSNSALFSASIDFTEEGGEDNSSDTADHLSVQETSHTVDADEGPHVMAAEASHPSPSPPALLHHAPVAMLFPLPHMLAYWFMMHHVSFYCHQVYRRMWGDQELTIAVSSRIISPTGHSVECRLFHSLRCPTIPCMFIKMMFTPGVLPSLTMQRKIADYSPYDSSSSSSSTDSQSSADADGPGSSPCKSASDVTDHRPVDARQVYDLFWTGFGRVEVECGPTISRSNLVRLRIALGLPVDFPMGLLWNVVMFASGIGPLILKEHRLSLHFNHAKTFTDVLADEFGAFACYGFGAQLPGRASNATAMANPIGTAVPVVVQGPLAQTANSGDLGTLEADVQADSGSDSVDYAPIGTLITSPMSSLMSFYSEMSSFEGYRSQTLSDISF